jgi:hypothetical protein
VGDPAEGHREVSGVLLGLEGLPGYPELLQTVKLRLGRQQQF